MFTHKAQKREFRHYLGGLLGESERKNLFQMAEDAIGVTYHRLHHFLTEAPWSGLKINERRSEIMGCIITIDAMGTQKSIAQKIIAADSDYILSLKDNHPTLHQQVKNWFETAQSNGFKDVDVSMSHFQ